MVWALHNIVSQDLDAAFQHVAVVGLLVPAAGLLLMTAWPFDITLSPSLLLTHRVLVSETSAVAPKWLDGALVFPPLAPRGTGGTTACASPR